MDDGSKVTARQKLNQLRVKIATHEKRKRQFMPWLEIYDHVVANNIDHEIIFLACINPDEKTFWEDALNQLKGYPFLAGQLLITTANPIHQAIIKNFGQINPLRYVPDIPVVFENEDDMQKALEHCATLVPPTKNVLFFYERYLPVLSVSFNGLCLHANSLIQPLENVFICAPDFSWLIFKSLEDEWRAGLAKH